MFIRIKPGEAYSYTVSKFPDRQYNQLLPVPVEKSWLLDLRFNLTPNQWYVYSVLLWYEHVKFEVATPTLETIWKEHCSLYMDEDTFNTTVESLTNLYFPDGDSLIKLVSWQLGEVEPIGLNNSQR